MKDYTEIIDVALEEFESDISLISKIDKFKAERKNAMRDREVQLRKRGLSDINIIHDIILSENLNARNDFLKKVRKDEQSRAEKRALLAKFLLAVIYFIVVGIIFFIDQFVNEDFEHSWLIIVAGILFFVIMLFLMPNRFHYKGQRKVPMHYALMISTALVAFFVWLVFEIIFHMEYSAIIITIALSAITCFDAFVPWITKTKHAIVHTIISLPLCGVYVYVTLGLSGILAFSKGWLIIVGAIALTIGIFLIAYNKKYRVSKHVRELRTYDYLDTEDDEYDVIEEA